ncbi:MAG: hypothetical protein ACI9BD_001336, partial [Candidatus Marinamargulisbacteria bacterium]
TVIEGIPASSKKARKTAASAEKPGPKKDTKPKAKKSKKEKETKSLDQELKKREDKIQDIMKQKGELT